MIRGFHYSNQNLSVVFKYKKSVKFALKELMIDEDLILFSDYPHCHHVFSDDDIFHVFGLRWPSG